MIAIRHRTQNSTSSDAETLQTDIMRFFAIICLCLMIVFALVQSLPVSQTENKPRMHDRELLEQQISNLEQKARELNQLLASLKSEIAAKQKTLEENTNALKQSLNRAEVLDRISREKVKDLKEKKQLFSAVSALIREAKSQEKKFRFLASEARDKLAQKRSDLDRISRLVVRGRDRLKIMEETLAETQQAVANLEKQKAVLKARQTELKKIEQRKADPLLGKAAKKNLSADAPPPPQAKPVETKAPVKPGPKPFPVQNEKEGFSLGFKTTQDLMYLLKQGKKVRFYMLSGDKAWMLSVTSLDSVSFVSANTPEKVYKMVRSTVPEKIIRAGRKVVAAFRKGEVTYGVTLAPDITAQFGRLMQGKKGGDLLISSLGKVSLE